MSNPAKVTKTTLFFAGGQLIGQGEITLPNIQPDMFESKAFGTSGTIEFPLRTFQAMECGVKVMAPNAAFFVSALDPDVPFRLQARGMFQTVDPASGVSTIAERVEVRLMQKGLDLGSRNQSEGGEFSGTFACHAIGYFVNGTEIFYLDPVNNIYRVNGVDKLSGDRATLGL